MIRVIVKRLLVGVLVMWGAASGVDLQRNRFVRQGPSRRSGRVPDGARVGSLAYVSVPAQLTCDHGLGVDRLVGDA